MKINTIEIFAGTKSFSKVAAKFGYNTLTIDNEPSLNPDWCKDIREIEIDCLLWPCQILWASPPCQAFSVASIGRNWTDGHIPKSDKARLGLELLDKTIGIISQVKPNLWYIENPRGMMRKIIDDIFKKYGIINYRRVTITYCQYGDTRMKPTDIWTNNFTWKPRPPCKNGDKCHIAAPRGSKTGTQGLKGAKERGVIPEQLFYEILK